MINDKLGKVKEEKPLGKDNKEKEIKFEDLPKKQQKKIIQDYWDKKRPIRKVEARSIETGTETIVKLVKDQPGIARHKIISATSYPKKKVKRIIDKCPMIRTEYMNKELRCYYVNILEK